MFQTAIKVSEMQLFFTITEFLKSLTHVFFSQITLRASLTGGLLLCAMYFNVPLNSHVAVIHCTTCSRFVHLKGLRNRWLFNLQWGSWYMYFCTSKYVLGQCYLCFNTRRSLLGKFSESLDNYRVSQKFFPLLYKSVNL